MYINYIYIYIYRYLRATDIHTSYIALDFLLRKHTRRRGSSAAAVYTEDLIIIIEYIFYKRYKIASH